MTSSTGVTPYERWYGEKPDVSNLKVFGCMGHVLVPETERRKWDRKTHSVYASSATIAPLASRDNDHLYNERRRKLWSGEM